MTTYSYTEGENYLYAGKDITSMLARLQQWYHSMCDGDCEHCYGVKIETSDNPGWIVEIDIIDTPLENKPFDPIHNGETDDNYFICKIENGKFGVAVM